MEPTFEDDRGFTTVDHLEPAITDLGGYRVRTRDLRFIGLEPAAIEAWRARICPLGLSSIQFKGLVEGLRDALRLDGVSPEDCDVRLQGSAARFFSGAHKPMPKNQDAVIDTFRDLRQKFPMAWQVKEIMSRLCDRWIDDAEYPTQRPFDSMYLLGIDRHRSDIDIQMSSDVMAERCEDLLRASGQPSSDARFKHKTYNFIRKDLVDRAFPNVLFYSRDMSDALDRHVSIATFPSSGPPDVSEIHPDLSSHLRPEDWVIHLHHPFEAAPNG